MNKVYIYTIVSAMILTACSVEEPMTSNVNGPVQVPVLSPDVVAGELLVRFDERVIGILENAGVVTKSGSEALSRSGILSVDEILDMVEGYQIERVFPVDPRSEETAEKEGLHQWYVVRFSKDHPVDEVAGKLVQLGEVSGVTYNRTLKRAGGQPKPLSSLALATDNQVSEGYFNDPLLKYQWNMVNGGSRQQVPFEAKATKSQATFVLGADVNVQKAWDLCKGHPSVIVAVLDEGVDINHPDLKNSLWENELEEWRSLEDADGNGYAGDKYGYNFVEGHGVISVGGRYDTGHGTHVAGVIAATNDNGKGVSSIAGGTETEPGVRIMSCQIFSGSMGGTLLDEIRAVKYAADNGAVILQCSWGYISGSANPLDWVPQFATDEEWISSNKLEKKAFDYFVHHAGSPDGVIEGGLIVFAAGNESAPSASYPAAYSDYISVAAIAPDFTPAVYTNYGPGTDISAPGGDQDYYYAYGSGLDAGLAGCIISTLPYTVTGTTGSELDGYGYMEGTSMACPHVSGVLALGLSYAAKQHKHFKAGELKKLLYKEGVTDFDGNWSVFMSGYPIKQYYKFVSSQQDVHFTSMDLQQYKGKMGHGLVNAHKFLKAISDNGKEMTFPNVFVKTGETKTYDASLYFSNEVSAVYVGNSGIAEITYVDGVISVKGVAEGQTEASVTVDGTAHRFVITVRSSVNQNGWL